MNKKKSIPIVLVGSGRSGTTWLLDVLTIDINYRPIFEPLHWLQIKKASEFHNLYLTKNDKFPALERFLNDIFYYRVDDGWLRWMHFGILKEEQLLRKILQYSYNFPKYKFWAKNRVVKFIKANLMIEWLEECFNPKIVYLIRHPCAVIASQRKMGWDSRLTRFLSQDGLVNEYLEPHIDLISSAKTELERLTILWCIENFILLKQIKKKDVTAFACIYENIVCEPENQLNNIMTYLAYPQAVARKTINKMKKKMSPYKGSLEKWQSNLSNMEIDYILDASNQFGIDIYGRDSFPVKQL